MKKLLFLCMILVLILIPTLSFADMGAPGFIVYSGYVSNPYGASYYDSSDEDAVESGTIPFQTKIICYSDYGGRRLAFVLDGEEFSYANNNIKYIEKYNVTIDNLTKYELGDKEEARTFENTIIYNMPTDATEGKVLGMIPVETDITVQPYRVNEEETGLWNEWTEWYYTSYNDVNGWIKINNIAFKVENDEGEYYTAVNLLTREGSFVPMLTPIKENYRFRGSDFSTGVFYYEGEAVEYNDLNIARKEDEYIYSFDILFDGVPLYEQANVQSKMIIDSLPIGTSLVVEYAVLDNPGEIWYGVRYNGSVCWLLVINMESYKNMVLAENRFGENKETLENAMANNWDWYNELDFPTDITGLKKYYEHQLEVEREYSQDAIEESDATKKITDKKARTDINASMDEILNDENLMSTPKDTTNGFDNSKILVILMVVLVLVFVLVITVVVIIILVNKNKKQ